MAELLEGINTETCEIQQSSLDITILAANIEVCEVLVSSFLCAIGVGLMADFEGRYYGSKSRFIAPLGVRGGFR